MGSLQDNLPLPQAGSRSTPCALCPRENLVTAVHNAADYRLLGTDALNYRVTVKRVHDVLPTLQPCPTCSRSDEPTVPCAVCTRPMPLGEALVSIRAGRGLRCAPERPGGPECTEGRRC